MHRIIATVLFSGALIAVAPAVVLAESIPKKGATSYVTHFVFHPLSSIDVPGAGKAISLEAVGPTVNMKGEKMLDKMKAKCTAVSIDAGGGVETFDLYTPAADDEADRRLKVYRSGAPLSLARALPIFSQMGIEVLDERAQHPYPLSGVAVRVVDYTVVSSGEQLETTTVHKHVVVTFNGTADVPISLGDYSCVLHLDSHKVDSCK